MNSLGNPICILLCIIALIALLVALLHGQSLPSSPPPNDADNVPNPPAFQFP